MLPITVIIPYISKHERVLANAINSAYRAGANEVKVMEDVGIGVCGVRNMLVRSAKNDFIVPLDADDTLLEDGLSALSEAWDFGRWVYGRYVVEHTIIDTPRIERLFEKSICHATILFHRTDFEMVGGYDPDFNIGCEDWQLCLSLQVAGVRGKQIKAPVYRKEPSDDGRSAKCFERRNAIRLLLAEKFPQIRA